jgi:hypothetical protein
MRTRILTIVAATLAVLGVGPSPVAAQQNDDGPAITARVHATFVDERGGLGVLSGDLSLVRFEVRSGVLTAIARIDGALADSAGTLLGPVSEELALGVTNVGSTCNQLRMDLSAHDADVLGRRVHFDGQTAGFDSRDGATPRALGVLCTAATVLQARPSAAALAKALDDVAVAVRASKAPR